MKCYLSVCIRLCLSVTSGLRCPCPLCKCLSGVKLIVGPGLGMEKNGSGSENSFIRGWIKMSSKLTPPPLNFGFYG